MYTIDKLPRLRKSSSSRSLSASRLRDQLLSRRRNHANVLQKSTTTLRSILPGEDKPIVNKIFHIHSKSVNTKRRIKKVIVHQNTEDTSVKNDLLIEQIKELRTTIREKEVSDLE
jgi:hypothetical protein